MVFASVKTGHKYHGYYIEAGPHSALASEALLVHCQGSMALIVDFMHAVRTGQSFACFAFQLRASRQTSRPLEVTLN